MSRRVIEVFADWSELGSPTRMGELSADVVRGKQVFSFEYDPAWLDLGQAQRLDPNLELYEGPQYSRQENFGVFLDSCPDRWGKVLMRRREAHIARKEGRRPRSLLASDYLLGVYDGHRMGALRFRVDSAGPFLDDNEALASPPWTSLRKLETISLRLEEEGVEEDPDYGKWLNQLVAPGSSLGGARPKASVINPDGHLWIAKFPSAQDDHDVGAWEWVVHTLAKDAGIVTASATCRAFSGKHRTFLTRRFDRDGAMRLHFASALTLLGKKAGEPGSYLDLANFIVSQGCRPNRDLEELFRRVVFNVCVSNVDDHLRNHGFLLDANVVGWRLSPAYDMNPVETGNGLNLDIDENDNAQDLELVRSVAPYFRIGDRRAREVMDAVKAAVSRWDERANEVGISRSERDRMANAFRLVTP